MVIVLERSGEDPFKIWQEQLVSVSADLRMARSSLARLRRRLAHEARTSARSARERQQEIEYLLDTHPEVRPLEDRILQLENAEERAQGQLKIILNQQRVQEWLVREALVDALNEFSRATSAPGLQMIGQMVVEQLTENGKVGSASDYIAERTLR